MCCLVLVLAKRNKNAWKDNDSFASKEFGSQVLNIYDRTENVENPREISLLESLAVAADQALAKKIGNLNFKIRKRSKFHC